MNGEEFKSYNVAKDDYPELEGKIINYDYGTGNGVKCLVVGCNRSVGVTVVELRDKKIYSLCYHGPVCPKPSNFIGKSVLGMNSLMHL